MAGTTINPYRFGGQIGYRRDGPNRLYVQQRHLDTSRGRWLSRDPALSVFQSTSSVATDSSSFNFYWYAKNNPETYVDPFGEAAIGALAKRKKKPCNIPYLPCISPQFEGNDKNNPPQCCKYGGTFKPVWITTFSPTRCGEQAAVYCKRSQQKGCLQYFQPLCIAGTHLSVPAVGGTTIDVVVNSCGCLQDKKGHQPKPNNVLDLALNRPGCTQFNSSSGWVCMDFGDDTSCTPLDE